MAFFVRKNYNQSYYDETINNGKGSRMMDQKMLEEIKQRLIATYNPTEMYIFGSYAWGSPDEESDLDLLIVVEKLDKDRYKSMADGHKSLIGLGVPKDILVYTQEEFDERAANVTTLCYKVKRKGKQIHAKA